MERMLRVIHYHQNNLKVKFCNHVLIILEEKHGMALQKCRKCFRIFEEKTD